MRPSGLTGRRGGRGVSPKVHAVLHVEWEACGGLAVGSGAGATPFVDIPALRSGRGDPVVPGSSLKGWVRHMARQIYKARHGHLCPAQLAPPPPRHYDPTHPCNCELCDLFGSPGFWPGTVRFSDLLPRDQAVFQVRAHVSMDRPRRVAAHRLLFAFEAATAPGVEPLVLVGTVEGYLPEDGLAPRLGLLYAALRLVPALGRGRSAGMGAGEMRVTLGGDLAGQEVKPEWVALWI